ncbi:MAG: AAA family ATPase [Flavobacteriales bacterium]|nr:MAG: AAA family ATPase [Flavobacteriales bacterium]
MDINDLLQNLREALEITPDNDKLRAHLAQTLLTAGKADEAAMEYKRVLQTSPRDNKSKLGLAKAFAALQQWSAAIVILEDLHNQGPPEHEVHLLYSRVLLQEGSFDKAMDIYEQLLRRWPDRPDADLDEEFRVTGNQGDATEEEGDDDGPPGELNARDLIVKSNVTFADVGGMQAVKDEIGLKIIQPLLHPDLYKAYGKKIGGGILLYGPPGCGKTHMARATAGEIKATFISMGISDVLDMWLGKSERNMKRIFDVARKNRPCVLFIDEIDALGANRGHMKHSGGSHVINQFLTEMDGIDADNEGLLIIGATNMPWHIDPAFRRPGRFDRTIFVPPPDTEGRASILEILLKGKPVKDVAVRDIAKKTEHFSGADLKAVIDLAIEEKLKSAMKTGVPEPLTTKDLLKAAGSHKATTREWFTTAKNYALYANESGLYDEILKYTK